MDVHDRDDAGKGLFLFAVKGAHVQRFEVRHFARLRKQIVKRLAQKAGRTAGAVVNSFADFGAVTCTIARISGRRV